MHAARPSHLPSCDAIPAAGRRRWRATVPLVAFVLILPFPAAAQEVRARDLSLIEDVLVETVQDAIQTTVRDINTENLEAQETARQSDEDIPLRYIFRAGSQTQARGMFLEDYGAIFTVQVPAMSYTTTQFYGLGNEFAIVRPGDPGSVEAAIQSAEVQLRAQMSRMDGELAVLRQRLESEVERGGADSESAQALRRSLESMQAAFDETQQAYSEYLARRDREVESRRQSVSSSDARAVTDRRAADRYGALRVMANATREEIAAAEDLAQEQRNQIEGAVIDAVVESLAQYGRIIHGLDDDDRLAVVLLPSSYLNPIGSWARATQRDEEFIISVRFGDVLDLDDGDLEEEEFRGRIRIERRLGRPRQE